MAECQSKQCVACQQIKPESEFRAKRRKCYKCELAAHKAYRDANPEKMKAFHKAWREANPEHHAAANLAWYYKHKDVVSERQRQYRLRNDHAVRERKREYHKKNAKTISLRVGEWRRANPLKRKAHHGTRRARKSSRPADWTEQDIAFAMEYWDNSCAACGTPLGLIAPVNWDHWIPLVSDECPGTVPQNMLPLCMTCNCQKQRRPAKVWLEERFTKQRASQILRRVAKYFRLVENFSQRKLG